MSQILKRNRAFFKGIEAGAVLLRTSESFPDSNVSYFTGLNKLLLSNHALVLKPGSKPVLLKSILETKLKVQGLRIKRIDSKKQFKSSLKSELKGIKKLGINRPLYSTAALRELKKLLGKKKLVDVSKNLASMRSTKSAGEITQISNACKIAQSVAGSIPGIFRKGMTEKQLALDIEIILREKGENVLPFPVIVASGKNAAFPHHVPNSQKIKKGLLLLDFGAYSKNYCSDISRVFCVGNPSKKQKQLYASVFAAKQFGQALSKPGSSFSQVFAKVNKFLLKETGFRLIHGLGHGLGVEAHDLPAGFLKEAKEKIGKNMVLTVEPGIYGKFGGIRLEDNILVKERGSRQLTKAPTELTTL